MNQPTVQTSNMIAHLLRSHPQQSWLDTSKMAGALQSLAACAGTCTFCADACLGEKMVAELTNCIRLNQDCAELCLTTAAVLVRSSANPQRSTLRHLVEACAAACQACGQECTRHAQMHEHCRICAEVCRYCEDSCRQLLGNL